MKILVTGKNGQVGSALLSAAPHNITVIALDRAALDITDRNSIDTTFAEITPDIVINAAAYTAVDKAEEDQEAAYAANKGAPGILAEACSAMDIPLIHISTDFVFDGDKRDPYSESDECNPLSVYGKSKWGGEQEVASKCGKHIILRTSWVFGGEQNFVNTMRRLAQTRDEISVVDDQRGGPTAAADIAKCLIKIASDVVVSGFNNWGIYHFCGEPSVSWYEFACEILKNNPQVTVKPIPTTSYPTPAKRPTNSVLDCQKIQAVFGISQPDWRDALTEQ